MRRPAVVLLGLMMGVVLVAGCATVPRERTVYSLTINPASTPETSHDGMTIRVRPVTHSNYKSFPKLYTQTKYNMIGYDASMLIPREWILPDLPAFELEITNTTGHILRFAKTEIRAIDDAGEIYEAQMKEDLLAMTNLTAELLAAKNVFVDPAPVTAKIRALKIVDRNFEILPDLTQKALITFDFDQHTAQDYKSFMATKDYIKLMLYEVPVETDEAGEVSRTATFEFIFDVKAETVIS